MVGSRSPDSGTDVMFSAEERREVLGRLGGEGRPHRVEEAGTLAGGFLLLVTGAPRPTARQCWKKRDKAVDAYAVVRSI